MERRKIIWFVWLVVTLTSIAMLFAPLIRQILERTRPTVDFP